MAEHSDHLSADIFKGIPSLLNDTLVLVEYNPGRGTNTVSAYGNLYTTNGTPVTVGVVVTESRSGTVVSKVRTVHARQDVGKQITDNSVLYLKPNKKEINAWFKARSNDVPLGGTQLGVIRSIDFTDSIAQKVDSVNTEKRFSLSKPVEETNDLVAVHNLDMDNLIKQLSVGGFAMPSIAVINSNDSYSKFLSDIFRKKNASYTTHIQCAKRDRLPIEKNDPIDSMYVKRYAA